MAQLDTLAPTQLSDGVGLWPVGQTDTQAGGGQRRWRWRPVPASRRRRRGGSSDLFEQAGSRAESKAAMSKRLVSRLLGMFQSRTQVGVDKTGNRYFTRVEEVDGAMKERRWVEFKGADQDSTTVPGIRVDLLVEWPKEESSNARRIG
nr:uncharacterized protein LOC117845560 isoform X3 [Setaria viridis]XP_034582516.1 uncharacterized protein LOC117845560 isoform X3 [Setaria viridis]